MAARRGQIKSSMGPLVRVVVPIGSKDGLKVTTTVDQDVVQALRADGPHEALGVTRWPAVLGSDGFPQEEVWSLARTVRAGSAVEAEVAGELIAGLERHLPKGLERFLELLQDSG